MSLPYKSNDSKILITFLNTESGEVIGQLRDKDGVLVFEGDAEQSAHNFFDYVCDIFNERSDELKRVRNN